jgi:hypothetical protein
MMGSLMENEKFYAVYNETSGAVVIFHSLPLEAEGRNTQKVAFTCEGVSAITVEGKLEKYVGNEQEYIVRNSKLTKKSEEEIRRIELSTELQEVRDEIKRSISTKVPISEEIQRTKAYLEWIKDGQPKNDEREKDFVEMQNMINSIKQDYAGPKTEVTQALEQLDKPSDVKTK